MKLVHAILLLASAASATAQFNGGSLPDLSQLGDIPGLAGSGLDSTLAGLGDMFNNRECLQERCAMSHVLTAACPGSPRCCRCCYKYSGRGGIDVGVVRHQVLKAAAAAFRDSRPSLRPSLLAADTLAQADKCGNAQFDTVRRSLAWYLTDVASFGCLPVA